ncbi:MAG: hypothetical protein ACOC1F_03185 [Myxococcota bacterium]
MRTVCLGTIAAVGMLACSGTTRPQTTPPPAGPSSPSPPFEAPGVTNPVAPAPPAPPQDASDQRPAAPGDTPTTISSSSPAPASEEPKVDDARIPYGGERYMPSTLQTLREAGEPPGRVTIDARFVRRLDCAPCPPRAKCQPCGTVLLFEETAGDRESGFGLLGTGLNKDTVYRLFLLLQPGYASTLGPEPSRDPRVHRVVLEGAEPLRSTH